MDTGGVNMKLPEIEGVDPVEDYMIGNTHIKIYDIYCYKTQEEIDAALERIKRITIESIRQRGG